MDEHGNEKGLGASPAVALFLGRLAGRQGSVTVKREYPAEG